MDQSCRKKSVEVHRVGGVSSVGKLRGNGALRSVCT